MLPSIQVVVVVFQVQQCGSGAVHALEDNVQGRLVQEVLCLLFWNGRWKLVYVITSFQQSLELGCLHFDLLRDWSA